MARKPGPLNPEGSGKGSLSLGQSSQGARAVANQRAGAGAAAKAAQAKGKMLPPSNDFKETINVQAMKRYFTLNGYTKSQIKTIFSGGTVKRGK